MIFHIYETFQMIAVSNLYLCENFGVLFCIQLIALSAEKYHNEILFDDKFGGNFGSKKS